MLSYIIKRILAMLPVLFFICLIAFGVVCLFPGDFFSPQQFGYAARGMRPEEALALLTEQRIAAGLDKPWFVQFWVWFTGLITTGTFGIRWQHLFRPEVGLLWTIVIAGSSMIWAWLLGIPFGIASALRKNTWLDYLMSTFTYICFSFPSYVWGTLFFVFVYTYINTHIRGPAMWGLVGYELIGKPLTWYKVGSHILHLLPAWVIVGAPMFASVARHMRVGMIEALDEPHIPIARSKGLHERRVVWKHALRNALGPLFSLFGMMLPRMLMGTILLGTVLGIPTFGQYMLGSLSWNRQHHLTAALLVYSCFLLFGNLFGDIMLALTDPRIRYD